MGLSTWTLLVTYCVGNLIGLTGFRLPASAGTGFVGMGEGSLLVSRRLDSGELCRARNSCSGLLVEPTLQNVPYLHLIAIPVEGFSYLATDDFARFAASPKISD